MSQALYRKYRSKTLDEVVGQRHITDILKNAIKSKRVSHAYLFTGPRGVGKTSVARILAHAINELPYDGSNQHLDIIEIDAASNNGVEDVRDLREKVKIAPTSARKKVYIIDEVHMLSKPAFNALLKTLEEPPEHIVFILATTDANKLPATIVSRTQRFNFRPIKLDDAIKHLANIAKQENIKISQEALQLIAKAGDGSFRDSISLLDQLSSLTDDEITAQLIIEALGIGDESTISGLIEAIDKGDTQKVVDNLDQAYSNGANCLSLTEQLISYLKDHITDNSSFLELMDRLTDVARSPQPQYKLLSTLGLAASQNKKTKSQPLTADSATVLQSPVIELAKLATKAHPGKKDTAEKDDKKSTIKKSSIKSGETFDKEKLLNYTSQEAVAVYTVLSLSTITKDADKLIIDTHNKFYKKKLEDPKYLNQLSKCLGEIGHDDLTIMVVANDLKIDSSKIDEITAMMGGGEAINLKA